MNAAAATSLPLVSVVVVNYNGGEAVLRCLATLLADQDPWAELLVVDNASRDGSRKELQKLAARTPELTLLLCERNLGYAGAVNLALPRTRGKYLAVLNMDVEVTAGWLRPLVAFLEDRPQAGAVNPLIALAGGERINAAGQDVHVTGLGFNRGLGQPIDSLARASFRVSGIQGGAFVVRRVLLDRLGGMDASGFLYHEDVNLSWLLHMLGYELYCVPASIVRHDYFLSMYPQKFFLLERNRQALLVTYLGWPALALLSPLLLATEILAWGFALLRGQAFVAAKRDAYRWVWARREAIGERRRWARSIRTVSDWQVLRRLRFGYHWDQFLSLGRERGASPRQPPGGLPTEAR